MKHLYALTLVAVLALASQPATAATINVPGDQPDVISAVAAATGGDTILITDSGTYRGTITVDKQIKLIAAPGQTPTLVSTGTLINLDVGCTGSQFGSLDGGRITLMHDTDLPGYTPGLKRIFSSAGDASVTDLLMENLFVTQIGSNLGTLQLLVEVDLGTASPTPMPVTFREVEVDANYPETTNAYGIIWSYRNNRVLNLERCKFYGTGGTSVVLHIFRNVTVNVDKCEFNLLEADEQSVVRFANSATHTPGPVVNINDSIFYSGGPAETIVSQNNFTTITGEVNASNSVFLSRSRGIINASRFTTFNFDADHCDLVVLDVNNEDNAIVYIQQPTSNGIVDLNIRNSNVVGFGSTPSTSTLPALNVVNRTGSDTYSLTYNNVYAPGWTGGLYTADLLPAVANSLSLNPGYVEAESGDMRYTNATLKTADSTGGAIGTDAIFTNIVPVELSAFGLL